MKKFRSSLLIGLVVAACCGVYFYSAETPEGSPLPPGSVLEVQPEPEPVPEPAPEPEPAQPEAGDLESTAREQLAELEVKGKAGRGGYERELFGDEWSNNKGLDVIDGSCDTRNLILAWQSDYVAYDADGCTVTWGVIRDPYSNEYIDFNRGDGQIEIDHRVSLANAWETGAFQWDDHTRRTFAHDPRNLVAVEMSLNRQKGAGDAATWLPPYKPYRCEFAAKQIEVKHAYGLWVAPAEHEALTRQLDSCAPAAG
ncbi:HNH endonuclease family protein [Corynebacterium lubricantis]|uniref:HNH endonuclease family protein n=1 Tax=Corynebacterium lubricantis TaxID=541095 RepID=UPI00037C4FA9|nr:HNH endonuclease family protein [Corynebacterium lubricantis]